MVATAPSGPKISYVTRLGLNGSASFARPAPALVVSLSEPNTPRTRETVYSALASTHTPNSGIHARLRTSILESLSPLSLLGSFPRGEHRRHISPVRQLHGQ